MKKLKRWTFAIMVAALTLLVMLSCNSPIQNMGIPDESSFVEHIIPGTSMLVRLNMFNNNGGRSLTGNTTDSQYGIFSINEISEITFGFDLHLLDVDGSIVNTSSHSLKRVNTMNIDGQIIPVFGASDQDINTENRVMLSFLKDVEGTLEWNSELGRYEELVKGGNFIGEDYDSLGKDSESNGRDDLDKNQGDNGVTTLPGNNDLNLEDEDFISKGSVDGTPDRNLPGSDETDDEISDDGSKDKGDSQIKPFVSWEQVVAAVVLICYVGSMFL